MKKLIYIIPILLLSIIFVNNVYGVEIDGYEFDFDYSHYQKEYPYYIIELSNSSSKCNGVHKVLHLYLFKELPFPLRIYSENIYKFSSTVPTAHTVVDPCGAYSSEFVEYPDGKSYNLFVRSTYPQIGCYCNFDVTVDETVIPANPLEVFEIKTPEIEVVCEYSDDYTSATLTANILNSTGNEKLYYSDDLMYNSGLHDSSSGTQHTGGGASFGEDIEKELFKEYTSSLSFDKNSVVVFKLYNSESTVIDTISYNITDIKTFDSVSFDVTFDTSQVGYLIFSPVLNSTSNAYYSIYSNCESSTSDLLITRNGNRLSDYTDSNYTLLSNNEIITMKYTGVFSANVKINFQIRNKSTGEIVLTRSYSYTISKASNSTLNNITENNSNTGGGLGNGFSSLNENSSINDIIESSKSTFSTFSSIFSILPGFVWAFLGVGLTVIIVLRIFGR